MKSAVVVNPMERMTSTSTMNAPTSDGELNTEELMRHRSTTRSQDKDKRGKQRLDESNSRYFNYINPWADIITVNVHEPHGAIIKLVTVFMAIHELELYTSLGYTQDFSVG